jgi:predicted RNase H-like HicB family nuclease
MAHDAAMIVRITVRSEGDYFYAASQDLPGLHVCGSTEEEVCSSALAAVKALFKHNRNMDVRVVPLTDDIDTLECDPGVFSGVVVQRSNA